ncbi:acid-sensing ion channel 5 [Drosophila nasuta]|uniref:acid-sensing ion channel 5 n=1 Tax=Drosophila nasuta TaxID=42062 RepID=UPI00295EA0FA|nr:acid-sensing ion channel 5 [Drosophila nasuta]
MSPKLSSGWKWLSLIYNFIALYFNNCCIHGFRYLVQGMLMLLERFLWLILLSISIYFCVVSCLSSVNRFQTKSTHIGIERNSYKWNVSLPSITVCPMQRLNDSRFAAYCLEHNVFGKDRTELRDFLEQLANSTYTNFENIPEYESIDHTLKNLNIEPENYMELIYNLTWDATHSEESGRVRCTDGSYEIRVTQVLTEFGLCYVCNTFLGLEYSASYVLFGEYPQLNGVLNESTLLPIKHGAFFEKDTGFTLIGFTNKAIDTYLHSPHDVMRLDSNFGYTEEGSAYELEIEHITTEPNLEKTTSVSQRKCRFFHESNLEHYPFYTKNSCSQECRLNLAYKVCKCIPHFYPNSRVKNPKPVCSYKILKSCFPKHAGLFLKFYEANGHHGKIDECICEQNCRDSVIRLTKASVMRGSQMLLRSLGSSALVKFWPKNQFKRQVIFSFTDFLVSLGGTAGLYLGFSVLGLIELFYFFSMRLFWHIFGYQI